MNTPAEISITAPFGEAFEWVKTVLFRPFDLAKWFVIGFCAWLAYLAESGGGFHGGNYNFGSGHGGTAGFRSQLEHARDYVVHNLGWIIPLGIGLLLVVLAISLLIVWLNSRGKFMFLHCVALNTAEVVLPWQKYAREANSLFLFRIVVSLIGTVVVLPMVGGLLVLIFGMILRETATVGGVAGCVGLFLGLMLVALVFWIIKRFLNDFVVPIQFLRGSGAVAAWRELFALMSGKGLYFILYLLFRVALAFGISLVVLFVVLITCCCAGCLLAIPYLGTVFYLPVLVLERSYSILFLRQFGPEYDVFPRPA